MLFLTSDFHLSHKNIIKYCPLTRGQFIYDNGDPNIISMNNAIVEMWNETVSNEDDVLFLGDWSLNHNTRNKFMKMLNGNISWIKGNHDKKLDFEILSNNPFYLGKYYTKYEDGYYYLFVHSPYDSKDLVEKFYKYNEKVRVICGHVHEKWRFIKAGMYIKEYITNEHRENGFETKYPIFNCGLDANAFRLVKWEDVVDLFKENE